MFTMEEEQLCAKILHEVKTGSVKLYEFVLTKNKESKDG